MKTVKLMVLSFLVCLVCSSYVNAMEIFDSFDRDDSDEVGYSEAIPGGRWMEVGDNNNSDLITVNQAGVPNALRFHYFASSPSSPQLACNVGGFVADDIDLTVKCACYSTGYGQYYGIAYRMPNQTFFPWNADASAYYVRINANATPNISLYYGDTLLDSANETITAGTYYTIRIVADGSHHKVYFNGDKVIDEYHYGNTDDGYVGLWSYYSIAYFDDFSVVNINDDETFSDDFDRSYSTDAGMMKHGGNYEWREVEDNYHDDLIEILDDQLDFHYFRSSPSESSLAANLREFEAADIDLSVTCTPNSGTSYNSYYGLSYRLDSTGNEYREDDGYYVQLNKKDGYVRLWYNDEQVAQTSITIPDGPSRLRVVARGETHQVYFYPNSQDTFNRSNSNSLGTLSSGTYSWTENESAADDIKIYNNLARFTYDANQPGLAANVADYVGSDMDISADVSADSGVYGLAYRLSSATSVYSANGISNGYYMLLDKGTPNKILFKCGHFLLADANITIPAGASTLRVVACGSTHKAYLNGELVLETQHAVRLVGGYCGMHTVSTSADFDNFVVIGRDVDPVITATDDSILDEGYVGVFNKSSITKFDNFKVDVLPKLYPQVSDEEEGQLPLMVYTLDAPHEMDMERPFGWNIIKSYNTDANKGLVASKNGSMRAYYPLPKDVNITLAQLQAIVNANEDNLHIGFWDLPEELRYWYPAEMALFRNAANASKQDGERRPRLMYIPSNYTDTGVANFLSNTDSNTIDVVPSSCYAYMINMPAAWIRWRMEETNDAITEANCTFGPDYLDGEKTPMGILELYAPSLEMTFDRAYHDFWQCIVSGAKAMAVYSYNYKNNTPEHKRAWDAYCRAADEIEGPEDIDWAVLYGTTLSARTVSYNSGTTQTPSFTTYDGAHQYASIDSLYMSWDGDYYLITVSSAIGSCNATISGLPTSETARVLFEGRTVSTNGSGQLTDDWDALGVHIYKFE